MRSSLKISAHSALILGLRLGLSLIGGSAMADEPDQLFCAASQAIVCSEQGECTRGLPETVSLPRMFKIGLKAQEVASLTPGGERRTSKVLNLVKENGLYVLQGAEGGKGWTATVNEGDGRLTVTASSSGEAYVVFGVCTSRF